jgi:hypothetical protein
MTSDPIVSNMMGQKGRYEMLHDISKLKGFNRFAAYLDPNAKPPGPDPLKVRELDIKEKTADAAMASVNVKQAADNRLFAATQSKLEQSGAKLHLDALNTDRTNDRQDADTAARIQLGEEQLDVEREKIAAQERTAELNAAAKAAQPKAAPGA